MKFKINILLESFISTEISYEFFKISIFIY